MWAWLSTSVAGTLLLSDCKGHIWDICQQDVKAVTTCDLSYHDYYWIKKQKMQQWFNFILDTKIYMYIYVCIY